LEGEITPTTKSPRAQPAHLMCGMPLWGIAAAMVCSYLAYVSYAHVRQGEFSWSHDFLSIVTYAVWVTLIAGLISETRCLRERLFFVLVFANFTLGFVLAVWAEAPFEMVRKAREISSALWALAAIASLVVALSPGSTAEKKADV
jgi:ABC-type transport system involved in cytochrome c biogenesis permease subunit